MTFAEVSTTFPQGNKKMSTHETHSLLINYSETSNTDTRPVFHSSFFFFFFSLIGMAYGMALALATCGTNNRNYKHINKWLAELKNIDSSLKTLDKEISTNAKLISAWGCNEGDDLTDVCQRMTQLMEVRDNPSIFFFLLWRWLCRSRKKVESKEGRRESCLVAAAFYYYPLPAYLSSVGLFSPFFSCLASPRLDSPFTLAL